VSTAPSPTPGTPSTTSAGASAPLARRRGRPPGPPRLPARPNASEQARRQAALILDVLAGVRTPLAAATVLEVAPVRYYQLEARAVDGLIAACEPRSRGRQPAGPDQAASSTRMTKLEGERRRLEGEVARLHALLRLSRLSMGVKPPPQASAPKPGGRKPRRAVVRALKHARAALAAPAPATAPSPSPTQQSPAISAGAARM
jgi:hypothetical protein